MADTIGVRFRNPGEAEWIKEENEILKLESERLVDEIQKMTLESEQMEHEEGP